MTKMVIPEKEKRGAEINRDFISFYVEDHEVDDVASYLISMIIAHSLMNSGETPKVFDASDSLFKCSEDD